MTITIIEKSSYVDPFDCSIDVTIAQGEKVKKYDAKLESFSTDAVADCLKPMLADFTK